MISVYVTTDRQEAVIKAIHSQHRLNELVSISSDTIANADIDIINDSIITLPDWKNTQPLFLYHHQLLLKKCCWALSMQN